MCAPRKKSKFFAFLWQNEGKNNSKKAAAEEGKVVETPPRIHASKEPLSQKTFQGLFGIPMLENPNPKTGKR